MALGAYVKVTIEDRDPECCMRRFLSVFGEHCWCLFVVWEFSEVYLQVVFENRADSKDL